MQQTAGSRSGRDRTLVRPPSILDVARLAGVSHQTVSRVLNGHPSIRDSTRSRVLAAIDQLQFRPNRAARMLSMRRSEMIGVLADAARSHYGPASSVRAVEDAARERGFYATVAHLESVEPDAISAAVGDLLNQDVEGIVIVVPRTAVLSHLASLHMNVPIVAAQGEPEDAGGIPVVSVDQRAGVRMLMGYLIRQGHERIKHLAGPQDWNAARSRLRAYEAEMRAADLPVLPPAYGDWTADSGYEVGRALLREAGRGDPADLGFSAVFSANDQMALGLIHAFREVGLDVPRDVSVASFDDIPESAHFWPPLTTVGRDYAELGVRCVSLLVGAISRAHDGPGAPGESVPGLPSVETREAAVSAVVQPELVVRDSVRPLDAAGRQTSY